jgi:hypothetical protein
MSPDHDQKEAAMDSETRQQVERLSALPGPFGQIARELGELMDFVESIPEGTRLSPRDKRKRQARARDARATVHAVTRERSQEELDAAYARLLARKRAQG